MRMDRGFLPSKSNYQKNTLTDFLENNNKQSSDLMKYRTLMRRLTEVMPGRSHPDLYVGDGFFYFKWISSPSFLPVIWVMIVTFSVYIIVHMVLLLKESRLKISNPQWLTDPYFWLLAGIFVLAMDFWAWRKVEPTVWGIPLWVGYFMILSALQTIMMLRLVNSD